MAKYLEDKRRRLQGQQTEVVQKQPIQFTPKTAPAVQTQAAAPAPAQKQTYTAPTAPAEKQSTTPAPAQTTTTPVQTHENDVVAQAQQYLDQQLGGYQSQYGSQITDLVQQLQNRPKFEYDVNTDPLYLQLRDIWKQDGMMAMEDTMGQAAQLTGGYGNSYAQTAGQQVYNDHLRGVAEMVPQLKEAARADYDAETDALLRQYGLLMEQDSQDYTRYMDELNRQYQMDRDALSDQRYKQEWEYQTGRDQLADQRYQDELAYGREQDQYQRQQQSYDRLLELIIATGYKPTAEELAAAGMTEAEAKAWQGYYAGSRSGGSSGSRSSGGGGGGGDPTPVVGDDDQDIDSIIDFIGNITGAGAPPLKEDYKTVSAKCATYSSNDAPPSMIAEYLKEALANGSITMTEYGNLMQLYGREAKKKDESNRSSGGGSFGKSGGSATGSGNTGYIGNSGKWFDRLW